MDRKPDGALLPTSSDVLSLLDTVIKHRVTALTGLLPMALTFGRSGPEAEDEELKVIMTQVFMITVTVLKVTLNLLEPGQSKSHPWQRHCSSILHP